MGSLNMTSPTKELEIDPGYSAKGQGCAVALFDDGVLVNVWFERPENFSPVFPMPDGKRVVAVSGLRRATYELPQQDKRSRSIPPSVLILLTAAGASLGGLYAGAGGCPLYAETPSKWKGSQSKPIMHRELWLKLTPRERLILGGDETLKVIEAACRKGGLDRWGKPGAEYYPASCTVHNLLDAAAMNVVRNKR
jgi:hypothetical protein